MAAVKNLQDYMNDHKNDAILFQVALGISLSIEGLPYSDSIHVIDGDVDLSSLEKGYYFRILDLGLGRFHLYGVEVLAKGDIIVHENIPSNQLENHRDDLFRDQLIHLNAQGRVYFRVAKTQGGGSDLHEDLAIKYATDGVVSNYVNPLLCSDSKFPKPVTPPVTKIKPLKIVEQEIPRQVPTVSDITSTFSRQRSVIKEPSLNPPVSSTPSCSSTLSFCSMFLATLGAAALIIGILAVVGIITAIAPPIGIALIVGGAVALGGGVGGFCFFGDDHKTDANSTDTESLSPKMD